MYSNRIIREITCPASPIAGVWRFEIPSWIPEVESEETLAHVYSISSRYRYIFLMLDHDLCLRWTETSGGESVPSLEPRCYVCLVYQVRNDRRS